MKHNRLLTITSLVSILLLTLHVTHDIVLGISKADSSNLFAILIFVILLYGPLMLPERRAGYVIMFLGGFFSLGMPAVHMYGAKYAEHAASGSGFFFIWTLFALGITGIFSMILSARGLWSIRGAQISAVEGV
jgi:hypothetical protein